MTCCTATRTSTCPACASSGRRSASIDPVRQAGRRPTPATFEADVLVVALGADLVPSATPGLVEGGHEFYTVAGAFALRDVLADFAGGHVVVGVTSTPFKCPPAPSETALLMHDLLRDKGCCAPRRSPRDAVRPCRSRRRRPRREALLAAFAERDIELAPGPWSALSTRSARSPCSPTAASCPTTCSSACPCTGRPRSSWSRGWPSTAGCRSIR